MPRTDSDTWNITESVGATALGVAAARAAETESDDPLIHDPFARIFVDAAGDGMWTLFANPALLAAASDIEPLVRTRVRQMIDFMAARTAFFDEFFLGAADADVRQVVILASGLDSRAWRLPWPNGTVVYELDQPRVLEFKSATLSRHGARPTAKLVNIPIDLRQDWPAALRDSGFDASKASAWSAEGLVRYLPARAQDLLFERIDALSPAGSWLAANVPEEGFLDPDLVRRQHEDMRRMRAAAGKLVEIQMPDVEELWYAEERTVLADWLADRGWEASVTTSAELLAHHGRPVPNDSEGPIPPTLFVSARRPVT
ncbi:Putative S-adenosyl-L-methionine-dependent methyltransferase [Mycobacterium basiliense]|uniref:S-adenosyl-L-methionine-dependent methyltransferase n=1 Tax=Mycobacterium basiliense TaxID=2094119 RepID=A0A3S4BJN6_9MYCO|nr:class I SAM-dependent methyltransferase [Mycobacterium basiliense]VDM91140.1 Putative S-adenosyl-L-methionine-dependent methyltransferase [Mycobacterium basiliense]